jgi:hypothetical protein
MGKDRQEHKLHEGGLLTLEVRAVESRVWLGPTWAVLCGAVASGRLELAWRVPLMVLLAVVLADPVLGSVWTLATDIGKRRLPQRRRGNPGNQSSMMALPYTAPGSVGHRASSFVARTATRWRSTIWPQVGSLVVGLGFLSLVALLMAAVLGRGPLVVTVVALGVAAAALLDARSRATVRAGVASCFLAGLPWLIGYTALSGATLEKQGPVALVQVLVWPALYAMSWYAYRSLGEQRSYKGALLLSLAHVLAVALLVVVRQPLMAGAVAVFLLPQLLLQPELLRVGDGLWYLRRAQVFTMCAMMAIAVAVAM